MPCIYTYNMFKTVNITTSNYEPNRGIDFHVNFGDGWTILTKDQLIQMRDECNRALELHATQLAVGPTEEDLDDAEVATQPHGPQYDRELDDTIPF